MSPAPARWRPALLLGAATAASGVLFVPFLLAGSTPTPSDSAAARVWIMFPLLSGVLVTVLAYLGLRQRPRVAFATPMLDALAGGPAPARGRLPTGTGVAILLGITLGLAGVGAARWAGLPHNPGTLTVRLLTAPWAALASETLSHLFALVLLLRIVPNRALGLTLSAALFVAIFHSGVAGSGLPATTIMTALTINFVLAIATGIMFLHYGFEAAVIAHLTSHLIAIGIN
jgi:hypothetical protein